MGVDGGKIRRGIAAMSRLPGRARRVPQTEAKIQIDRAFAVLHLYRSAFCLRGTGQRNMALLGRDSVKRIFERLFWFGFTHCTMPWISAGLLYGVQFFHNYNIPAERRLLGVKRRSGTL